MNKVILYGRLGADPEIRTTTSGTAVGNLRVATSERRKNADGAWEDATEWHRVCCFGSQAENVGKFLRKGSEVLIEGKIATRKWQDNDGNDRWSTEIIAFRIQFVGGKSEGSGDGGGGGGGGGGYGGSGGGQGGGNQRGGGNGGGQRGGGGSGGSGGGGGGVRGSPHPWGGGADQYGGNGGPDDDIPF